MTEHSLEQIVSWVRRDPLAYLRLTILVGGMGSGKTAALSRIAAELGYPWINLNLQLSQRLLSLSRRQRTLQVKAIASEIAECNGAPGVCIDNTELLFDSSLKINPLRFLQELARNRVVITTWNGAVRLGRLIYASPEHPDRFDQPAGGCRLITLKNSEPELLIAT